MKVTNNQVIRLADIEFLSYDNFFSNVNEALNHDEAHCVHYFAKPNPDRDGEFSLFCLIANDAHHDIDLLASVINKRDELQSLTAQHLCLHPFEREMHELYDICFVGHPWLKPLRYSHDRKAGGDIYDYPFYEIDSEELHRVGVGPIHAGIIEPGHFRFICEGEKILHLEIQLGWQHRGIENLFVEKKKLLQRATLSENIAGDTVVGHATAFAHIAESLAGWNTPEWLEIERAIALEQERIAVHTGDLSGICTDVAYQLGNAVFGRLRTPMINYMQKWCGSRFAKSLIRPFKTNFIFTEQLAEEWQNTIDKYKPDFVEMAEQMFDLPSVLSRIERTGIVTKENALNIGLVGMPAKSSGLLRDTRKSHPWGAYKDVDFQPIVKTSGDVYARARMRYEEVLASIELIQRLIAQRKETVMTDISDAPRTWSAQPESLAISLTEGWRGEICHVAITDKEGELALYKIKDPSMHNWLGLALAVRGNGISDFPICNKSFDLSYCGHDL
ncbi:MAG: NADH-quinone oxidoreductase subunit C [Marinilabiliaceae bacterium]|nr:NADH-quinone oxidoreductase subunit C [Marinilabiliaceae bacterium]